jgi:hypothetical protein
MPPSHSGNLKWTGSKSKSTSIERLGKPEYWVPLRVELGDISESNVLVSFPYYEAISLSS